MTNSHSSHTQLSVMRPTSKDWCSLEVDSKDKEKNQAAELERERLKEALLASLQMQHVVVLAGSGTSLGPVGGPSMYDLWNATTKDSKDALALAIAEKVRHDINNKNIEEFLSKCEAYLQVSEDSDVIDFVSTCKEIILEQCSTFLNPDNLNAHKMFIHRLSRRRVRDARLKIFTTNYDLCFERAAATLGGVVIDGFSFMTPRYYDPRYFSYDIIRRTNQNDDQGSYLEGVFLLYKLHGSVNWARDSQNLILEKDKPSPKEACLIYPALGKYQQSFLQPHLESMSQYLAVLREPNTCLLVMGFGFNDDHLAEPILGAIRSNPHLRLIIADPYIIQRRESKTNTNRFWQELFSHAKDGEDIWFINATFQEFSKLIPDLKSLTPADKLMNAVNSMMKKP